MTIDDKIRELLKWYIQRYVDQLCEGVLDWYDASTVAGSEESGEWVHATVAITYWVHPDVEPRMGVPNYRHYNWDTDAITMIRHLEELSRKQS